MIESCQNGKATARMSAAPIQSKIEKIKKRKLNYAAMRADANCQERNTKLFANRQMTRLPAWSRS